MALAIAGGVIATSVLAYQAATQANNRAGALGRIELPEGLAGNFHGAAYAASNSIYVYNAPNFGALARAELLRTEFYEDIGRANAVFCLVRNGPSSAAARPSHLNVVSNYDFRRINSPDAFRALLESSLPATAGIFSSYANVGNQQNLSIYVLQPTESTNQIEVRSVYEMDLVSTTSPPGTYASVRRYRSGVRDRFYEIFYPANEDFSPVGFSPVAVCFDRAAGGDDVYRVATPKPFFFVWWPDPGVASLGNAESAVVPSGDPRAAYGSMIGRTSLFMVVPMFPSL